MIIVIGSGPAGISAAKALIERGHQVTLLDAGVQLEPERRELVRELCATGPDAWPAASVDQARRQMPVELGGVPLKYTFGSDFPYQDVDRFLALENVGSATYASLARGGFSTVWGAAAMPYLAEDLDDWPISVEDLAPHYRAVTGWLPLSARRDDLEAELPLYCEAPDPLQPSAQAAAFMRDLERASERLRRGGLRFGWSRLAVRASASPHGRGCTYCGFCMNGCPYGLIYDSSSTLVDLMRRGEVRYHGDVVVERLEESGERVKIRAVSRKDESPVEFEAERVYVACGTVSTTRLLLASLDALDRSVEMKDSQYFLLPLLRFRGVPNPRKESLHTLSQLFLELRDPRVDPRNVHLQIYGWNELFVSLFDRLLGPLARPARPAVDGLLKRMLLIQGYLHSDSSPTIRATLRPGTERPSLVLEAQQNPATRPALRRVVTRLLRHTLDLAALPLWPALQVALAGRGFHSGGTFPMRETPAEFECDVLGRPHGFARVHVVDSTTFPTIPSTTITFSVMANAHRIASSIDQL